MQHPASLPSIPFVDLRDASPRALVEQFPEKAIALIRASRDAFGLASRAASYVGLPLGDHISDAWLRKTRNPYRDEIQHYARHLRVPGVVALNLSYEWGCTSAVYAAEGQSPRLTRVLDWPFPALGKHMVVAHQSGAAGSFFNVTWPAVSGVFQAMAPGRFAVALNQAPMRRYQTGIVMDWVRNRVRVHRHHALPPAHVLRQVCESARDYHEAKERLCHTPLALPVIFILAGTKPGEGCVIERLEDAHALRPLHEGRVGAANHFESHLNGIGHGWLPRAQQSHARAWQARGQCATDIDDNFAWFAPPIANPLSRLAMVADAANATLRVMGTEGVTPVTQLFSL